jgi:hypothetical protein
MVNLVLQGTARQGAPYHSNVTVFELTFETLAVAMNFTGVAIAFLVHGLCMGLQRVVAHGEQ